MFETPDKERQRFEEWATASQYRLDVTPGSGESAYKYYGCDVAWAAWQAAISGNLKLFVWRKFCPDYSDGLAFAIAHDEPEARCIVLKDLGFDPMDWGPCDVHELTEPIGAACAGKESD